MFHPGETVSQTFTIPFVASEVSTIVVTYKQNDHVILIKTITSGIEPVNSVKASITVALSQEESLLFREKMPYRIQLNVFTNGGTRAASCEIKDETGAQHYKEVISSV